MHSRGLLVRAPAVPLRQQGDEEGRNDSNLSRSEGGERNGTARTAPQGGAAPRGTTEPRGDAEGHLWYRPEMRGRPTHSWRRLHEDSPAWRQGTEPGGKGPRPAPQAAYVRSPFVHSPTVKASQQLLPDGVLLSPRKFSLTPAWRCGHGRRRGVRTEREQQSRQHLLHEAGVCHPGQELRCLYHCFVQN